MLPNRSQRMTVVTRHHLAEFIALSREAIPQLLGYVERLLTELESAQETITFLQDQQRSRELQERLDEREQRRVRRSKSED
jgi:hypothetical protein